MSYGVPVRALANQQRLLPQVLEDTLPGLEPVQPRIRSGIVGHATVEADHLYALQIVALADLVVVGIMRRRHLDDTRAELRIDEIICNDGNFASEQR